MLDLEAEALCIYRDAGADPENPPAMIALAMGLIGAEKVHLVEGLRTPGLYRASTDEILVRRGLPPLQRRFTFGHEIMERHFTRQGLRDEQREQLCNQGAARLQVPAPAFKLAFREYGLDLAALADTFRTTQSVVALRYGEVFRQPVLLVTPGRLLSRSTDDFGWGESEIAARELAHTSRLPAGMRRLQLSDARGRTLLIAA